ncbi:hypothetical protein V8F33_008698 [Rhypophila sp. PSN 637]
MFDKEMDPIRYWTDHADDPVSFCRFPMLEKLRHLTLCGRWEYRTPAYRIPSSLFNAMLTKTPNLEALVIDDMSLPPDIHLPGSLRSLTLQYCRLFLVKIVDFDKGTCYFPESLLQHYHRLICFRVEPRGPMYEFESDKDLSLFRRYRIRYEASEWGPQILRLIDEDDEDDEDDEPLEGVFDPYMTSYDYNRGDIKTVQTAKAVIKAIQPHSVFTTLERLHWGVLDGASGKELSPTIYSPQQILRTKKCLDALFEP